jgi:hypothetical protein
MAFGTVAYLAPEQAKGDAVGFETDVYSLGCVVYELLTGRLPFEVPDGPDQKRLLMHAHLEELPEAPSTVRPELELPAWVDDVVGWTLVKDPHERIRDVRTFARLFRAGLEGENLDDAHATAVNARDTAPQRTGPSRRIALHRRRRPESVVEEEAHDHLPELREDRAGRLERMYRRGGRMARRSRKFRGKLWRVFFVMIIATLMLGMAVAARQGPEALVERFLSVAPGTETTVIVDRLNLRAGPGIESQMLGVLPTGTTVRVTGLSETVGEYRFWPVETQLDGAEVSGWVWDGGLHANAWTGRMAWMQDIVERVQDARRSIAHGWDRATGWIPGLVASPV